MSQYLFGVRESDGRFSAWDRVLRRAIAERHGCEWTEIYEPGSGRWKSWFSKRNEGRPFDQNVEDEVLKEVANG
jgi:hypothetical protein